VERSIFDHILLKNSRTFGVDARERMDPFAAGAKQTAMAPNC